MGEFEKYLSAEEACSALGEKGIPIKPRTLQERAAAGEFPSLKVNGRRRYRLSELLAFISSAKPAH